jgi:thiol:disulfide interchange protein DsbD
MKTSILLLALAAALAAPALWLLLTQQSRTAAIGASILLFLATASGYAGVRLLQERQQHQASFIYTADAGQFQTIEAAHLPAALAQGKGRPVILEFYADWCPSCVVWKERVFSRKDVQSSLKPFVLLQVDATELTPEIQNLLDKHGLPGLPAILVYDRTGVEHPEFRLLGEMKAADFIIWLDQTVLPAM